MFRVLTDEMQHSSDVSTLLLLPYLQLWNEGEIIKEQSTVKLISCLKSPI